MPTPPPLCNAVILSVLLAGLALAQTTRPLAYLDLEQRLDDISLEGRTVQQVVMAVQEKTRMNILGHWRDLETSGFDLHRKLSGQLKNVPIRMVLEYALTEAGGQPARHTIQIEGNVVHLAPQPRTEIRVYNIGKVLTVLVNEEKSVAGQAKPYGDRLDEVIQLIMNSVSADTWRDAGGTQGSISTLGVRLCIEQTQANHERIRQLLDKLEKADGQ